jgi:hypothetical protein
MARISDLRSPSLNVANDERHVSLSVEASYGKRTSVEGGFYKERGRVRRERTRDRRVARMRPL